ncbi:MAG: hypothetical protein ACXVXF_07540, partial [Mycobacteriaceae bacterium]
MPASLWILLCSALLAVVAWRRSGWSPLGLSLVLWLGIALVVLVNPIGLTTVSGETAVIVCLGLASMTLAAAAWGSSSPAGDEVPQGASSPALARLVLCSGMAAVMVVVGVIAFRNGVSSATGLDIASLTPTEVRAAQTGSARGGGLESLFQAVNPLLGCLGAYGALRYSRLWWIAVALALAASLQ